MNNTTKEFLRNHLGAYIDSFEFEDINGTQGGMNAQEWFCKLVQYWDDKDEILAIYDRIDQKHPLPEWFDMPYNFTEDECLYLISNINDLYVTNGCNFGGNAGFWYRDVVHKKNFKDSVRNYYSLPWNLWLKNENLLKDDVWDEIIGAIKSNKSHSSNFKHLPAYQDVPKDKIIQLFNLLEDKIRSDKSLLKKCYIPVMNKDFQHSEILKQESYHLNKIKDIVKENGIEKDHLIAAIYYT